MKARSRRWLGTIEELGIDAEVGPPLTRHSPQLSPRRSRDLQFFAVRAFTGEIKTISISR